MNTDKKFLVCLYSEPNFLAVNLLENLLVHNCYVNVVSKDTSKWDSLTGHVATKNRFSILDVNQSVVGLKYDYVFFCGGFINQKLMPKDLSLFQSKIKFAQAKTLFVLPLESCSFIGAKVNEISAGAENIGTVYIGDLLGPRLDLESDLRIARHVSDIAGKRHIVAAKDEILFPLFVGDAAKQLMKSLFAFGPFGKTILLLGPETPLNAFLQTCNSLIGNIKVGYRDNEATISAPQDATVIRIDKKLSFMLSETFNWIQKNSPDISQPKKSKTVKTGAIKKIIAKHSKKTKLLFSVLVAVFIMPLLTLLISGGLSYLSYRLFLQGNTASAKSFLYAGKVLSNIGFYESAVLEHIPGINLVYKETSYGLRAVYNLSNIGINSVPLVEKTGKLMDSIFADAPYSLTEVLQGSSSKIQRIYTDLSVLDRETDDYGNRGSLLAKWVVNNIQLKEYKSKVLQAVGIEDVLYYTLGMEKSQTYLVLFENNMELRPTGGFIGSYGLLTFDKGRLSDFTVSDVYSADGQLNGHVEPPEAIRKYLGEANWWLRDSNWDPDFPTTAKRVEWFLNKETDKQVDGVLSVDLEPVKDFLQVNGPVYLNDFGMDITPKNLYEKVQSEVEDNFFPGTHKKASFLTALARSIVNQLSDLNGSKKLQFFKLAYQNLEGRHIQIFLHDGGAQGRISKLNWDGSVSVPFCQESCTSDLLGIVEANVGDNKSNYFITRRADLTVEISQDEILKILTVTFTNSANPSLGPSGKYKNYIRILTNESSQNIEAISSFGQSAQKLDPEISNSKGHKEIGVLLEVLAGEEKHVTFSWTEKTNSDMDSYQLYVRKQAGIEDYPVNIQVKTTIAPISQIPTFTLTKDGRYLYNTTLAKDIFARFTF